jgi:predicted phage terminase large subunit-like protein
LQQSPAPSEGGIIKREWVKSYKVSGMFVEGPDFRFRPVDHLRFATVDPAVSIREQADYCVMAAWAVYLSTRGPILCLVDLVRDRMEGPDIVPRLQQLHERWGFSLIGVETVAYQLSILQQARREGLPVREISSKEDAIYRLDRDKVARAYAATPLMADGRFFIPESSPWLSDYVKELLYFPNGEHDDCVDVTSAAVAIAERMAPNLTWGGDNNRRARHLGTMEDRGFHSPEEPAGEEDPFEGLRPDE